MYSDYYLNNDALNKQTTSKQVVISVLRRMIVGRWASPLSFVALSQKNCRVICEFNWLYQELFMASCCAMFSEGTNSLAYSVPTQGFVLAPLSSHLPAYQCWSTSKWIAAFC